jgi:hypothetical protein
MEGLEKIGSGTTGSTGNDSGGGRESVLVTAARRHGYGGMDYDRSHPPR